MKDWSADPFTYQTSHRNAVYDVRVPKMNQQTKRALMVAAVLIAAAVVAYYLERRRVPLPAGASGTKPALPPQSPTSGYHPTTPVFHPAATGAGGGPTGYETEAPPEPEDWHDTSGDTAGPTAEAQHDAYENTYAQQGGGAFSHN